MNIIFYIIALGITIPSYGAIKNKSNPYKTDILCTINDISHPRYVACFNDGIHDIVTIASTHALHINQFFKNRNCLKHKIVKKIKYNEGGTITAIAQHPTQPLLAILTQNQPPKINNLQVLNIFTQKRIANLEEENLQEPLAFNPMDETVLVGLNLRFLRTFNYHNFQTKCYRLHLPLHSPVFTFNPKRPECILCTQLDHISHQSIAFIRTKKKERINIRCTNSDTIAAAKAINALLYSTDGSKLIINHQNGEYNVRDTNRDTLIQKNMSLYNNALAIHPSSYILATYSTKEQCISYWDTQGKTPIAKTKLPNLSMMPGFYPNSMQFFHDGTKLIIIIGKAWHVLKVPFNAQYLPGAEKKCILWYYWLGQYLHHNKQLPKDIQNLLLQHLIAVHKYSFTNY